MLWRVFPVIITMLILYALWSLVGDAWFILLWILGGALALITFFHQAKHGGIVIHNHEQHLREYGWTVRDGKFEIQRLGFLMAFCLLVLFVGFPASVFAVVGAVMD